jgi:hypothetical protein
MAYAPVRLLQLEVQRPESPSRRYQNETCVAKATGVEDEDSYAWNSDKDYQN